MILFRGAENHFEFRSVVFFSTSRDFANEYGVVKNYDVVMENTFDTLMKEHVEIIFKQCGELIDLYDNRLFKNFEEYCSSGNFASDTWEIFEQYIAIVKNHGFDSMKIYEGGVENYVVFTDCFKLLDK